MMYNHIMVRVFGLRTIITGDETVYKRGRELRNGQMHNCIHIFIYHMQFHVLKRETPV